MRDLESLSGLRIGDYTLMLLEARQLKSSGWKGIKLSLCGGSGNMSDQPVVKGIYSPGGRNGIKPWMDLDFRETFLLGGGNGAGIDVNLSRDGLDGEIFSALSGLIPPGGHLMVSYEGDDTVHIETLRGLGRGIPPAATPLGFLLFTSGFHYIKDWYLAEGGHEGPRKLWGEKARDGKSDRAYLERSAKGVKTFLKNSPSRKADELMERARDRARKVIEITGSRI